MIKELSIRIQRAISHANILKQQALRNLKEVDEYLEANKESLIEHIFKEKLQIGNYVEYDSYSDFSKDVKFWWATSYRSNPDYIFSTIVSDSKMGFIQISIESKELIKSLENYLDGLKYVTNLTSVPEDIMFSLSAAEELSSIDYIDAETLVMDGIKNWKELEVYLTSTEFEHKGKYYRLKSTVPDNRDEDCADIVETVEILSDQEDSSSATGAFFVIGLILAIVIGVVLNT